MTVHQRWGLTAAFLLFFSLSTIGISAITGMWNGWALLGVLAFFGFVWITVKKD